MKQRITLLLAVLFVAASLVAQPAAKVRSERILRDAERLAGLLHDARVDVAMSPAMWRTIVNEANTLSNRIYANTSGHAAARLIARDLRTHVRMMREAALKGDASGARDHAGQAMPFAMKLIDWAD